MKITISDERQAAAVWKAAGQTGPVPATLHVVAATRGTPRECLCGCKGTTGGGLWLPGHDAKRKSALHALVRTGTAAEAKKAKAELADRGWPLPAEKKAKAEAPAPVGPKATAEAATPEHAAAREAAADAA